MENTPLLETERLILRRFTPMDLDALFAIFADEEVNTYLPWFPLKTMEAAWTVIKQVKKDGLLCLTAIHDRENPRSGQVLRRLGMLYQYFYEEQWQPKDIPILFRMFQNGIICDD